MVLGESGRGLYAQHPDRSLADVSAGCRSQRYRACAAMAAVESEKIYFDYDSSELKSEAQEILTKKAEWLKENGDAILKITGHCDERGSTEYNMALGSRRAEAASKFLNALGVSSDRLKTVSMGEEQPAVAGTGEAVWSKNRRDEFELQ